MYFITTVLLIIIISALLLIWAIATYNQFQSFIIRINEVEANIDTTLRRRFDLLNKADEICKVVVKNNDYFKDLKQLKEERLSNFELDRRLYPIISELETLKITNPEINANENFNKIFLSLHESELEIGAYRKYYNDYITKYNHKAKSFPSIIIAILSRFKVKPYYDNKNQYDKDINDFKL